MATFSQRGIIIVFLSTILVCTMARSVFQYREKDQNDLMKRRYNLRQLINAALYKRASFDPSLRTITQQDLEDELGVDLSAMSDVDWHDWVNSNRKYAF
jgi:hypothetical protein